MAKVLVTLALDGDGFDTEQLEQDLQDFIQSQTEGSIETLRSCSIDIVEEDD
jgi:hypothetical protein